MPEYIIRARWLFNEHRLEFGHVRQVTQSGRDVPLLVGIGEDGRVPTCYPTYDGESFPIALDTKPKAELLVSPSSHIDNHVASLSSTYFEPRKAFLDSETQEMFDPLVARADPTDTRRITRYRPARFDVLHTFLNTRPRLAQQIDSLIRRDRIGNIPLISAIPFSPLRPRRPERRT